MNRAVPVMKDGPFGFAVQAEIPNHPKPNTDASKAFKHLTALTNALARHVTPAITTNQAA